MASRHRKPGPIRKTAETLLGGAAGIGAVTAVATVLHTGAGTPAAAGTSAQSAPARVGTTSAQTGAAPAVVVDGDTPVADTSDTPTADTPATGSATNPAAPAPSSDVADNAPRIQYEPTHAAPTAPSQYNAPFYPQPTQDSPPPVTRSRPSDPPTSGLPTQAPSSPPTTAPAPPTSTPSQPGTGGGDGGSGSGLGGLLDGVLGTLGSLTGTVLGGLGRH